MPSDILDTPIAPRKDRRNKTNHKAHDRYVRDCLSHPLIAEQFFKSYLPQDIQQHLDWNTLSIAKTDFIDDKLREKIIDVLWQVTDKAHRQTLWLLLEHIASRQTEITYDIKRRCEFIRNYYRDKHPKKTLPIIVPVVIYQHKRAYCGHVDFYQNFDNPHLAAYVDQLPLKIAHPNGLSDEELRSSGGFLACFQWLLKYIKTPHLEKHIAQHIDLFRSVIDHEYGLRFLRASMEYVLHKGDIHDTDKFVTLLEQSINPELASDVMTTAQRLEYKGLQQGLQQGEQHGLQKGIHDVATRLLHERVSLEFIKRATGLSLVEIKKIKQEDSGS